MPYQPHIRVSFRIAEPSEFSTGRAADIRELPGGRLEFLLRRGHAWRSLAEQATLQGAHDTVHGRWRQNWTGSERMDRPPLGLLLSVFRWEGVQPDDMPDGHLFYPITYEGGCVVAVNEDSHSRQLRNDMNDLLLRAAGDGLWNQYWPHSKRQPGIGRPTPPLAPAVLL